MSMTRPLIRRALHAVFACGLGIIMATPVPTMPSMSAVTEQMHGDHPDEEQHPDPIL